MSSKQPSALPIIDWGKFHQLPKTRGPLLDVEALRSRLALGLENPVRRQVGIFRAPVIARLDQYMGIRNAAIKRFIGSMEKDGWDLVSRIQVRPSRFAATPPDSNIILEDMVEYTIRANFQQRRFKRVRLEVAALTEGDPQSASGKADVP